MLTLLLATALARPVVPVTTVSQGPVIDGVMDDAAWRAAKPVTDFTRFIPSPGGAPPGTTEVLLLQDATTLYVGVRIRDPGYAIRARVSPREAINADDQIGLYLDPFDESQQGFIFYFNPLGIQQDIQYDAGRWNFAWNTVIQSEGRVTDDGFELEIAIPYRSIRYPSWGTEQSWGILLTRKIPGDGAKYSFPETVRGHPRVFVQAAELRGVRPPPRGAGVELIPGLAFRGALGRDQAPDPISWRPRPPLNTVAPFLDLRAGPTPGTTIVLTVNPDFSEVESDITPVVLNERFALRYPERRTFFIEGAGFLQDPQDTLYTRSFVQPIYGAKALVREGPWSAAALHALDRTPDPSFHQFSSPGFSDDDVQGRMSFGTMARLRRDLPGAGRVGMTFADRRLAMPNLARVPFGVAGGSHTSLGLDAEIALAPRWALTTWHDQSFTGVPSERIGGSFTGARVRRPSGEGLGVDVGAMALSRGYRQELGFRNQTGLTDATAHVDWTFAGKGTLSTVTPMLAGRAYELWDDEHYRQARGGVEVLLDGVHRLSFKGGPDHRRERRPGEVGNVAGYTLDLDYYGQIGAVVEHWIDLEAGRMMDFSTLGPSSFVRASADLVLRPAKPLRIDLLARTLELLTAGDRDLLTRARVGWQLHRDFGMRLIGEANLQPGRPWRLEGSALMTWLPQPFTAAHIGAAGRTFVGTAGPLGPPIGATDIAVFAKLQVWTRPGDVRRRRPLDVDPDDATAARGGRLGHTDPIDDPSYRRMRDTWALRRPMLGW